MNKKIKMIELLNMIANGELKNNTKFNIINEDGDIFKCKYSSTYPGYIWVIDNEEISFNYKIDHLRILDYEVEILEDNTEDIEEIDLFDNGQGFNDIKIIIQSYDRNFQKLNDVVNKIGRAVNQLRKDKSNE